MFKKLLTFSLDFKDRWMSFRIQIRFHEEFDLNIAWYCLLTVINNYMINCYAHHCLKRQFVWHFIFSYIISNLHWNTFSFQMSFKSCKYISILCLSYILLLFYIFFQSNTETTLKGSVIYWKMMFFCSPYHICVLTFPLMSNREVVESYGIIFY